jgi:hypothetical protein
LFLYAINKYIKKIKTANGRPLNFTAREIEESKSPLIRVIEVTCFTKSKIPRKEEKSKR